MVVVLSYKSTTIKCGLLSAQGYFSVFRDNILNDDNIHAYSFSAKTRSIAIPVDLDAQITMMFNQTVMMAKSTQKWLSHGKKKESVVSKPLSKDYRNIIEGLQVCQTCMQHIYLETLEMNFVLLLLLVIATFNFSL